MEIIEHLLDLTHVFVLHFSTSDTLLAIGVWIREQDLVNDDVTDIDVLLGKLYGQPLGLIHREELRDANSDEGGGVWVPKLLVDLLSLLLHSIECLEQLLVHCLWVGSLSLHHSVHGAQHASELLLQLDELYDSLFQDVWEVEQPQGMASGSSIEDDQVEVVLIKGLEHLTK